MKLFSIAINEHIFILNFCAKPLVWQTFSIVIREFDIQFRMLRITTDYWISTDKKNKPTNPRTSKQANKNK